MKKKLDRAFSRGRATGRWTCIVIGSVLAGLGWLLVSAALGRTEMEMNVPPWGIGALGLALIVPGLLLIKSGVLNLLQSARARIVRYRCPEKYWLADRRWNESGIGDDCLLAVARSIVFPVWLALFMAPFHAATIGLWMTGNWGWIVFGAGCLIFDLVIVALLFPSLKIAVRALRFGRTRLRFKTFPFFICESLDIDVIHRPSLAAAGDVEVQLRLVEETTESNNAVAYSHYDKQVTVEAAQWNAETETSLSIPIPRNPEWNTQLRSSPIRYWELALFVPRKGLDYKTTYLLPIYEPCGDVLDRWANKS